MIEFHVKNLIESNSLWVKEGLWGSTGEGLGLRF